MLPNVYVCYTSDLTAKEVATIKRGAHDLATITGLSFKLLGDGKWSRGVYRSANKLVHAVPVNREGKLDACELLTLLQRELSYFEASGIMMLFTSKDMATRDTNWCYGAARGNVNVQSVCRYRCLPEKEAAACIRRTMAHELGHNMGCAADARRSNTEENIGRHCTNPMCTMRQTLNLAELRRAICDEGGKPHFCAQCSADMAAFRQIHSEAQPKIQIRKITMRRAEPANHLQEIQNILAGKHRRRAIE